MDRKKINKKEVVAQLAEKLKKEHVFWSYKQINIADIGDDKIIEKVLLYLDIEDIICLYHLYPRKTIMRVWKEKLLSNNEIYASLNRFYAFWLFEIKDPDKYIAKFMKSREYNSI